MDENKKAKLGPLRQVMMDNIWAAVEQTFDPYSRSWEEGERVQIDRFDARAHLESLPPKPREASPIDEEDERTKERRAVAYEAFRYDVSCDL